MTEYIVNVPDEATEYFIAKFGLDDVTMLGYHLTGEVVRCRDCKYKCAHYSCLHWNACIGDLDAFCSFGKLKEGDDDRQPNDRAERNGAPACAA